MTNVTLASPPQDVLDKISRAVVEQYVDIQMRGTCNMLDLRCVRGVALRYGHHDLVSLTLEQYELLLRHYAALLRHYEIEL